MAETNKVALDPSLITNQGLYSYGHSGPAWSTDEDLGNTGTGTNSFWNSFSLGDLGKIGLGLYSILSNNRNNKKSLALAKENLLFNKNQAAANYLQNATGWANQQLWNAQAMYNFDPTQGTQYANNLMGSFQNLNDAGAKLGLTDSLTNQMNSLMQYTQLKPNAYGPATSTDTDLGNQTQQTQVQTQNKVNQ